MALSLREAGIGVQNGTVSVERHWASVVDMFPSAGRCLFKAWFELLADLSYMRYNYRHFNHAGLPSWCRNDTLLGEKFDLLSTAGRSLMEQCSNELSDHATDWSGDGLDLLTGDAFQEPVLAS